MVTSPLATEGGSFSSIQDFILENPRTLQGSSTGPILYRVTHCLRVERVVENHRASVTTSKQIIVHGELDTMSSVLWAESA
jgi:hypothetical protein